MWLQLLHCYILPLITFHSGDFQAVSRAQTDHMQLLSSIDESLEEISLKTFKVIYLHGLKINCTYYFHS